MKRQTNPAKGSDSLGAPDNHQQETAPDGRGDLYIFLGYAEGVGKTYAMLEAAPVKKFDHIVSWVQNGTAFKVHNAQGFMANVIYEWFDQTKYESFRRQ